MSPLEFYNLISIILILIVSCEYILFVTMVL
jgi:hypothetical protein